MKFWDLLLYKKAEKNNKALLFFDYNARLQLSSPEQKN